MSQYRPNIVFGDITCKNCGRGPNEHSASGGCDKPVELDSAESLCADLLAIAKRIDAYARLAGTEKRIGAIRAYAFAIRARDHLNGRANSYQDRTLNGEFTAKPK